MVKRLALLLSAGAHLPLQLGNVVHVLNQEGFSSMVADNHVWATIELSGREEKRKNRSRQLVGVYMEVDHSLCATCNR